MITPEDVKAMDINEIVSTWERKVGRPLSSSSQVFLAMAHGAARGGGSLTVVNLSSGEGVSQEMVDYEALAKLFNGPDAPRQPRPRFTVSIPNPDHFLQTLDEAARIGPEAFSSLCVDLIQLMLWAMRDYRDGLNISSDYCPHSFYWTMEQDGQVVYNGGLIRDGDKWGIHT